MSRGCRNDAATMRFIIDGVRGAGPVGAEDSLIDFA